MSDLFIVDKDLSHRKVGTCTEFEDLNWMEDVPVQYSLDFRFNDKQAVQELMKQLQIDRQSVKMKIIKIIGKRFYSLSMKSKLGLILHFQMTRKEQLLRMV